MKLTNILVIFRLHIYIFKLNDILTGARVILACRDLDKAEKAVNDIKSSVKPMDEQPLGELIIKKLDLASLKSIKQCAKDILLSEERINILVNNAGKWLTLLWYKKDFFHGNPSSTWSWLTFILSLFDASFVPKNVKFLLTCFSTYLIISVKNS